MSRPCAKRCATRSARAAIRRARASRAKRR
ncbi:hypothetical protein R2601_03063 [Salipiger bermudensis HTCC2601]|uniref:Uncharacterized protein n=1 Tax=Salipiger bermudensis (strain DSM 26914 / JCM 13377 / KCTC 12554 / HTCC2601) TaxID=314265 RepID=Q0FWN3_SALBH|nr:hypothetical protein R2601_03063 [Salipiger bermudensis HTCC2601]